MTPTQVQNLSKGIRFGSGQPINPGGRPKGLMQLVRAQTGNGEELIQKALSIVRGEFKIEHEYIRKDGEVGVYSEQPSARDTLQAIEYLTDRGFGKAVDLRMELEAGDEQKELAKQIARELAAKPPLSSPSDLIKAPHIQS